MEDNMTPEEIQSSIRAAFDSVNLINGIIDGTQMQNESAQEKEDTVERNVGHLNIMMGKSWFADALTDQENADITAAITAGNGYSAS
jgi:hypothetical protein